MRTTTSIARRELQKAKAVQPPIDVEAIARRNGVKVKYAALEGDISGLLYKKGSKAVIGVNALHPLVRQRFTLAHELGHFLLHQDGSFFVDRKILFRDPNSSAGKDPLEIEANRFAAELLMPEEMILSMIEEENLELDDEESMEKLAGAFQVSSQAMTIRLKSLGFSIEN